MRRIEQVLCLQQTWKKGRVGREKISGVAKIVELKIEDLTGEIRRRGRLRSKIITQIAGIADIARHRRDREPSIPPKED